MAAPHTHARRASPVFTAAAHHALPVDVLTALTTAVVLALSALLCLTARDCDVERILTAALLALGFVAMPVGAAATVCAQRAAAAPTSPAAPPDAFPALSPLLARLLTLTTPTLVSDIAAATRAFTCAGTDAPAQCAVCLVDVCAPQPARALPCGHVFHRGCADAWLLSTRKNSCPLCSHPVCSHRDADMRALPRSARADPPVAKCT